MMLITRSAMTESFLRHALKSLKSLLIHTILPKLPENLKIDNTPSL